MKKKLVVVTAVAVFLALVGYLVLPGLLVKWATESERKAAGLQQKTVRVGDHEIAYLEGGTARPSSWSMALQPTKTIGPVSPN